MENIKKLLTTFILTLLASYGFAIFDSVGDDMDRFLLRYYYIYGDSDSSNRDGGLPVSSISQGMIVPQGNGDSLIFSTTAKRSNNYFNPSVTRVYLITSSSTTPYQTKLIGFFYDNEIIPIQDVRDAFQARGYTININGNTLTTFPE